MPRSTFLEGGAGQPGYRWGRHGAEFTSGLVGIVVLAGVLALTLGGCGSSDDGPIEAHIAAFARLVEATTPPASVALDETDAGLRAWCRDAQPRLHSLVDDDFLDPPDRELARWSAAWLQAAEHYLSRCIEGMFTNETVRPLDGLEDVIGYHEDRLLESDQG